jgi:xanthine/CO dehydrogenase XdhC/CoxF family maturation factor
MASLNLHVLEDARFCRERMRWFELSAEEVGRLHGPVGLHIG